MLAGVGTDVMYAGSSPLLGIRRPLQSSLHAAAGCEGQGRCPHPRPHAGTADDQKTGRVAGDITCVLVVCKYQSAAQTWRICVDMKASAGGGGRGKVGRGGGWGGNILRGVCLQTCTMDSRASRPSRWAPVGLTGTPMTGNGVSAATMPGRCAAPPAPAMMAWEGGRTELTHCRVTLNTS